MSSSICLPALYSGSMSRPDNRIYQRSRRFLSEEQKLRPATRFRHLRRHEIFEPFAGGGDCSGTGSC